MQRVLIFVLLGMLMAGCVPLSTTTEGASGPITWHLTDLKTTAVPGESQGMYAFTLVLKESQGTPITFTYRKDTIYASGLTVLRSVDQAIDLRLRPYEERRIPVTFTWGCPAGDCRKLGIVAPIWVMNITGSDEKGQAVQAVIKIRLPDNPDTYKPPSKAIKTEGQPLKTLGSIEAPVPVWKPGYEWKYRWESPRGRGTFVWTVKGEERVDGVEYYVITAGRQRAIYWRKADLAYSMDKVEGAVETRAVPSELRYVWPLVPGRRWEQTFTRERPLENQTEEISSTCQVEAEETITVPAGSFRAFKIVCRNQRTGSLRSETWYSPEVKQSIRERGRFSYGMRERELIDFKLE